MNPTLARKLLLGLGGLTAVAVVGFVVWNLVMERPPKHARVVAADMPADSLGMLSLADPERVLKILDETVPSEVHDELEQQLGADPFEAASWKEWGIDVGAPIGVGMRDPKQPTVVISLGLDDADKARAGIESLSKSLELHADWKQRKFGDAEGMWNDEPPVAVVFRGDRLIVVASDESDEREVERTAETIAEQGSGDGLAGTEGFGRLQRFEGDPIAMVYVNIDAIEDEVPEARQLDFDDVDGMAFAFSVDGGDLIWAAQTVMSPDATYLQYLEDRDRSNRALDRVPGPVYAGAHWSVEPGYAAEAIDQLAKIDGDELADLERELERELGVSLERDLLEAWAGELGMLLTGAGEDDWGGVMFVSVRDDEAAEQLLRQVWKQTDGERDRETEVGTLYTWDERPDVAAIVADGYLWIGVGESRIEDIGGDDKGFRHTVESDAVADVVSSAEVGIGFVDIGALWGIRDELGFGRNPLEDYAKIIGQLDALSFRAGLEGDIFVGSMILHTKFEDAFESLTTKLIEAGFSSGELELAGLMQGAKCERAADHVIEVFSNELGDKGAEPPSDMRQKFIDECETSDEKIDLDCVLAAQTVEAMTKCQN